MPSLEFELPALPFYWRLRPRGSQGLNPVPDLLPFAFAFDPELQLVQQRRTPELLHHLDTIYSRDYNVGYLQDENDLARLYGTDLQRFVGDVIQSRGGPFESALEIGCGGCVMLEWLQQQGTRVLGVDPSPVAARAGARKQIQVTPHFFPHPSIPTDFDVILHADVLEHVDDPVNFLAGHRGHLGERGAIVVAVPDCTASIAAGDVSMVLHQHLNYFDHDSLRRTVEAAGFTVERIEAARYGGSLYCYAVPGTERSSKRDKAASPPEPQAKFEGFIVAAARSATVVRERIDRSIASPGTSVGFYAPLRAFPYLATGRPYCGFRLFDDTGHWHGQEFDGVPIAIENMDDLVRRPVDDLFIMTTTFGQVIRQKLLSRMSAPPRIMLVEDLLVGAS